MVPGIYTNPENGIGYYSSSKPENVDENKYRPVLTWLCVGGALLALLFRNAIVGPSPGFGAAAAALNAGPGDSAKEGGEYEALADNEY